MLNWATHVHIYWVRTLMQITPECISLDIAAKCQLQALKHDVRIGMILDCFCGVGGNVISMAARVDCQLVCAVDIDGRKLDMLRLTIYEGDILYTCVYSTR